MAQEATLMQEGVERVRDAYESVEDEAKRVQKQLRTRRRKLERQLESTRKDIEKRIDSTRKDIEKRAKKIRVEVQKSPAAKRIDSTRKDFEKRAKKMRTEVQKNPAIRRLEAWRKDATKQYEAGVETFLSALQIASKSDLQRIDRKISQLNRKLREMERPKAARKGSEPSSASA